jgi:hypothetical protein
MFFATTSLKMQRFYVKNIELIYAVVMMFGGLELCGAGVERFPVGTIEAAKIRRSMRRTKTTLQQDHTVEVPSKDADFFTDLRFPLAMQHIVFGYLANKMIRKNIKSAADDELGYVFQLYESSWVAVLPEGPSQPAFSLACYETICGLPRVRFEQGLGPSEEELFLRYGRTFEKSQNLTARILGSCVLQ